MTWLADRLALLEEDGSALQFPLPLVNVTMSQCAICKFCCSWCGYISEEGCQAPPDYELLEVCRAFPILMGSSESRWPSLGVEEEGDVYPPDFGAFAVYGRNCQSTQDERQRVLFQLAARKLNNGERRFVVYEETPDYMVLIRVTDVLSRKQTGIKADKTGKQTG